MNLPSFRFFFVGSLLVAAAHFGGIVWGSDIDYLMLHGKGTYKFFLNKYLVLNVLSQCF